MAINGQDDIEMEQLLPAANLEEEDEAPETRDDKTIARNLTEREMIDRGKPNPEPGSGSPNPGENGFNQNEIDIVYKRCKSRGLNILFAGVTGSGKSSLANAIVGEKVFEVPPSDNQPECTDSFTTKVSGKTSGRSSHITIRAWDCPGLSNNQGSDDRCIAEMRCVVKRFQPGDVIVFCIEAQARLRPTREDEVVQALLRIKQMWNVKIFQENFMIALTKVESSTNKIKQFQAKFKRLQKGIYEILERCIGLDPKIIQGIKIFPVLPHGESDTFPDTLPDGTRWLSSFWFGYLNAIPGLVGDKKFQEYFIDETNHGPSDLSDQFIPADLLVEKRKYGMIGAAIGAIGLIIPPVAIATIPLGYKTGKKIASKIYIEEVKNDSDRQE